MKVTVSFTFCRLVKGDHGESPACGSHRLRSLRSHIGAQSCLSSNSTKVQTHSACPNKHRGADLYGNYDTSPFMKGQRPFIWSFILYLRTPLTSLISTWFEVRATSQIAVGHFVLSFIWDLPPATRSHRFI